MQQPPASVAIAGAGDYIGAAVARRFAREGYHVFAGRRNGDKLASLTAEIEAAGGMCTGLSLDARQEDAVVDFIRRADEAAPLEVAIFNIGANVNYPLLDTTERVFRKVWELACYAGFLDRAGGGAAMLPHGRGSIFFTGATASIRGGSGYAAFAAAKFGLRAVAQSMARELGRQNIHVAHLVIDFGVDTGWVRQRIAASGGLAGGPRADESGLHRRDLLAAAPPAARRLDPRTRSAAQSGTLVRTTPMDVQFHFDFGSPNAYLAHRVIPAIEARTGVPFRYVPVLLGGVFKATGNRSPMEAYAGIRNKLAYEQLETQRFINRYGIEEFRPNPFFPVNTLAIMRGAAAAELDGTLAAYATAVFHHMWEAPKKLDDPAALRARAGGVRPGRGGDHGAGAGPGGEGEADRQYRRFRCPRHLRLPHFFRRQRHLVRQGSSARR